MLQNAIRRLKANRSLKRHAAPARERAADDLAPLLKVSVAELMQGFAAMICYVACVLLGVGALGLFVLGLFKLATISALAGGVVLGAALLVAGGCYLALRMGAGILRGRRAWAVAFIIVLLFCTQVEGLGAFWMLEDARWMMEDVHTRQAVPAAVQALFILAAAGALALALRDKSAWKARP
jgi:hypothetical protein